MILDEINKWYDEYEIKARLFPSVILCLPLFILGMAIPKEFFSKIYLLIGESIIFVVFLKIFVGFSQLAGNVYQDDIQKRWNGLPSTRFLRREDSRYSAEFKEKFVLKAKALLDIDLNIDSDKSIDTSIFAIKTYLHKYDREKIWHKFNIEYGFYRNLSGLRPWLFCIHIIALFVYFGFIYFNIALLSETILVVWVMIFFVYLILSLTSPRNCMINAEHYADSIIMSFYEIK